MLQQGEQSARAEKAKCSIRASDMLQQRAKTIQQEKTDTKSITGPSNTTKRVKKKLSYKENKALEAASLQMEQLNEDMLTLETEIADPNLFDRDPKLFQSKIDQLAKVKSELEEVEEEWLRLETLREELEG